MEKEIKTERKKLTLVDLNKMKSKNQQVAWITSYDTPFAYSAETAGIDMILVGDSGGMCQLGYQTTNPVVMDEMIILAKSVRRGAPNTFIIGDMPQGSYEVGDKEAVINALRFVKEAGCDAIKLEGGKRMCSRVKAITDAGILVMGHLGLTPQSTSSFGGYRVQGKTVDSFEKTLEDAFALQEAGVFSILLEAIPSEPAGQVTKQLKVPIYGIGAGQIVDGQLVICHDLMGFFPSFRPWFAKCYIPGVIKEFEQYISGIQDIRKVGIEERKDGLLVLASMAIKKYIEEVKNGSFPKEEYSYPLKETDLNILKMSKMWK
jgi:3-methyl-2-oxobutanoate hydroxymethyltransferase